MPGCVTPRGGVCSALACMQLSPETCEWQNVCLCARTRVGMGKCQAAAARDQPPKGHQGRHTLGPGALSVATAVNSPVRTFLVCSGRGKKALAACRRIRPRRMFQPMQQVLE